MVSGSAGPTSFFSADGTGPGGEEKNPSLKSVFMFVLLFLSCKATGVVLAVTSPASDRCGTEPALLWDGGGQTALAPRGGTRRRGEGPAQGRPGHRSGQGGQLPALPQPLKDSESPAQALFSTSLSPNRDQNHTNMLKSPPKLLFWFQDDAIWVPVSSLQMQAGGGERKAAETRLGSRTKPSPGPNPVCPAGVKTQCRAATPPEIREPPFPQDRQQNQRAQVLPAQDPSRRLQVTNLGRLQRAGAKAGFKQAPEEFEEKKRHIFLTQIQALSGEKQMPSAQPALLSCNKTTRRAKTGRVWGGKKSAQPLNDGGELAFAPARGG